MRATAHFPNFRELNMRLDRYVLRGGARGPVLECVPEVLVRAARADPRRRVLALDLRSDGHCDGHALVT
jgi:hypothetical protein